MTWWRRARSTDSSHMDYPGTNFWLSSPNFRRSDANRITMVIIHTTQGGATDEGGAINKFRSPSTGAGIHYIVNRAGEITQMVRDRNFTFHVGGSIWHRYNRCSIGIEHVNNRGQTLTAPQLRASVGLVRWLCRTYSIPRRYVLEAGASGIKGHHEVSPNGKPCPGENWSWDNYMNRLNPRQQASPWPIPQ